MRKLVTLGMLIALFTAGYVAGAQKQTTAVLTHKLELTMFDGRGRMEQRVYDVTSWKVDPQATKITIINPTLFRCGYEP